MCVKVDVYVDRRVGVLVSVVRRGVVFRRIIVVMVVICWCYVVFDCIVGVVK